MFKKKRLKNIPILFILEILLSNPRYILQFKKSYIETPHNVTRQNMTSHKSYCRIQMNKITICGRYLTKCFTFLQPLKQWNVCWIQNGRKEKLTQIQRLYSLTEKAL